MNRLKFHLDRAERNAKLLDDQVGSPSMISMPQTTNQAIVLILKDLCEAMSIMKDELQQIISE